jgi:hypothetical protein
VIRLPGSYRVACFYKTESFHTVYIKIYVILMSGSHVVLLF